MDEKAAEVDVIAERIRQYLHDHPNAADTIEGVARWWLLGNSGVEWLLLVKSAVDKLAAAGVVKLNTLADDTVIIRRGERNLDC